MMKFKIMLMLDMFLPVRLIMQHMKSALSFPYIRTLNTGEVVCHSEKHVYIVEWRVNLQKTAFVASAVHLRKLFAVILTFCESSEPILLWNMFKPQMCDDFTNKGI